MKNLIASVLWLCEFGVVALGEENKSLEDKPPNIIVFLVDDMGIMDTSVPFLTDETGAEKSYPLNSYYRTPNMMRLAETGGRLNQFCSMSVCSPSRISLLTGMNSARHRTTNWIDPDRDNAGPYGPPDWNWKGLDSKSNSVARHLQSVGYRTIHVGKGHFGPRGSIGSDPTNLGFDINIAGSSIGAPASYYGMENFDKPNPKTSQKSPSAVSGLEKYHGTETFLTQALSLSACEQMESAVKADKPFFLYLAHYAVHAPFQSDSKFANHYRDSGRDKPAQAFATLVEGVDQSLGEIVQKVKELQCGERTLLLFLGDNGSDAPLGDPHSVSSSAPLRGKKGSHYEGGTRVPFIASWVIPDDKIHYQRRFPIASGTIQSQLSAIYDLFPTILVAAMVPKSQWDQSRLDGRSLWGIFSNASATDNDKYFLMHYPHAPHRSDYFTTFRDQNWKVIYHYFPTETNLKNRYELYHLASDPFEQTDLSDSKPDELNRQMSKMVQLLAEQQAVFPVDPVAKKPLIPVLPIE